MQQEENNTEITSQKNLQWLPDAQENTTHRAQASDSPSLANVLEKMNFLRLKRIKQIYTQTYYHGTVIHKRDILQFNHISETFGLCGALQMFPNANVIKGPCYSPKVDNGRHFFFSVYKMIYFLKKYILKEKEERAPLFC